jgi:hypothetical protein
MRIIRATVFDIGGVLFVSDSQDAFYDHWAEKIGLSSHKLKELLGTGQISRRPMSVRLVPTSIISGLLLASAQNRLWSLQSLKQCS